MSVGGWKGEKVRRWAGETAPRDARTQQKGDSLDYSPMVVTMDMIHGM